MRHHPSHAEKTRHLRVLLGHITNQCHDCTAVTSARLFQMVESAIWNFSQSRSHQFSNPGVRVPQKNGLRMPADRTTDQPTDGPDNTPAPKPADLLSITHSNGAEH